MRRSDLLVALQAIASNSNYQVMHTVEVIHEHIDKRMDIMLMSLPSPATTVTVKILKTRNTTPSSFNMRFKNGN
jgi:hypothetical protein